MFPSALCFGTRSFSRLSSVNTAGVDIYTRNHLKKVDIFIFFSSTPKIKRAWRPPEELCEEPLRNHCFRLLYTNIYYILIYTILYTNILYTNLYYTESGGRLVHNVGAKTAKVTFRFTGRPWNG